MKIAITGTTSGIGAALLQSLSLCHEVVQLNRDSLALPINLSGVDILVNNAGHSLGGGVGLRGHENWSDIIETNLNLPILLTQNFIEQNSKGKIIYITSKSIEMDIGGDSVYSASKSGLSTFVKCMRHELKGSDFKLVEIRPGRVKTNFAKNRQIHSADVLETFYEQREYLDVSAIVNVVNFAINNDCVETITVEK